MQRLTMDQAQYWVDQAQRVGIVSAKVTRQRKSYGDAGSVLETIEREAQVDQARASGYDYQVECLDSNGYTQYGDERRLMDGVHSVRMLPAGIRDTVVQAVFRLAVRDRLAATAAANKIKQWAWRS